MSTMLLISFHIFRMGKSMDFLERLFHIAPDGGDGTIEAAYFILAGMVITVAVFRRRVLGLVRKRTGTGG